MSYDVNKNIWCKKIKQVHIPSFCFICKFIRKLLQMEMRYLLSINIMTYLLLYAFYFGYINYL